ncbi:MAG: iron ABC transporter permease [Turicibacter sp.]|nr:iron ABC transporter permease [Turicibacter sp.]
MSKKLKIIVLVMSALLAILLSVSIGGADIPISDIGRVFAYRLFGAPLPSDMPSVTAGLIWNIRLPRVLLSFVVGASLAVSGSVMQSVLKNPLASSYTVGVSAGAGLGVVLIIVFGISSTVLGAFLMPLTAIVFGMATIVFAVLVASRMSHALNDQSIILVGMILSVFVNAIMMTFASRSPEYAQQIAMWQMGSLSMRGWHVVGIISAASTVLILWLCRYAKEMDILTFGDEQASAVGVDVKKMKWFLLLLSSMLTAVSVAFVGVIGFVDLIAPHIIRRFFGAAHRYVLPLSALFGGLFLVLADLLSRTLIAPSEIPIGSITALIGAPFFGYLFLKNSKRKAGAS